MRRVREMTANGETSSGTYSLLSPADIRKWDIFDGRDSEWLAWSFASASALQELGWGDLLTAAQKSPNTVRDDEHGDDVRQASRNLFSLLAQRTRGKAQGVVRRLGALAANGLEA